MANILINFMTGNSGGTVNFKKNFIENIDKITLNSKNKYFVIISNPKKLFIKENDNIHFIKNLKNLNTTYQKLYFYEKKLNKVIYKYNIDVLLNFGDIPAKTSCTQIFYFDWPYIVYDDYSLWSRMKLKDFFLKLSKRIYFILVAHRVDEFIVQSNTMKIRLEKKYQNAKIKIVDVGFNENELELYKKKRISLNTPPILIYPTAIYPHKNLEALLKTAEILKEKNFFLKFQLTFSKKIGNEEKKFCGKVKKKRLDKYFQFLGRLNRKDLLKKISSSTGIIMPTLIETYGLPYLEAQVLGKPVFTSRRDFAKEICKNSGIYFDPLNPKEIADVLIKYSGNLNFLKKKIYLSKKQLKKRINWHKSVKLMNEIILKHLQ